MNNLRLPIILVWVLLRLKFYTCKNFGKKLPIQNPSKPVDGTSS